MVSEQWELNTMYTFCDVPATRYSLDSRRFVMLIPPSPSEIIKRQVLSHSKKITVGDGWM